MEVERRQSFTFWNAEGLKYGVITKQMRTELFQKDHETYESRSNEIRINYREDEEKLKLLSISEDSSHFDERQSSDKAQDTAKKENSRRERKSLAV